MADARIKLAIDVSNACFVYGDAFVAVDGERIPPEQVRYAGIKIRCPDAERQDVYTKALRREEAK